MNRMARWTSISIALLIAGVAGAQSTPAPTIPKVPPELEPKFKQADINQRGGLDKPQATSAGFAVEGRSRPSTTTRTASSRCTRSAATWPRRGAWTTADSDGDGSISRSEADQSPSLANIFTQADRDGDGIVRKEEHEAFSQTSLYQNVDLPYVVPNIINKKF